MTAEVSKEAQPALGRDDANFPQKRGVRQDREKTQANERCRLETAGGKFFVSGRNDFIKAFDALLELSADATSQKVAERRQAAEQNNRSVLNLAIGLRQRSKGDVAFVHGRKSAAVYSGSLSP
jgi:hypothetical protein